MLAVQHQQSAPPGWLGEWVVESGVGVEVVRPDQGAAVPADLGRYDGLLVLGGRMGARDDREAPWLPAVRALIATVVSADRPFLGVCLGHQLAAVALGGAVEPGPETRSRGLVPFQPTAAGRDDRLLGGIAEGAPVLHYNSDVVTELPDGADPLAHAPDGTLQAVRLGRRAWGVQCHPEVDASIVRAWLEDDHGPASGWSPDGEPAETVRRVRDAEPRLRRHWAPLGHAFAAEVLADGTAAG